MNFKKGFTLIELLVVVALIGILSTIGIVAFSGFTESSAQKAAENSLSAMRLAQQEYKSNNGTFYQTSGTTGVCNPTIATTTNIVDNLFGGTDNLKEQRYYFCITATSTEYTLTAKHSSKTCQVTLNNLNIYNRTGCDA
jgi:type IV pilus assembly protein PilE